MSINIQLPAGTSHVLVREVPRLIADALHPHTGADTTRIVTHLMKLCDEPGTIPAPQSEPLTGEDWRLIETIWRELPIYRPGMSESEWQIYAYNFETSKAKPRWQLIAFWDETEGRDKMTRFLTEVQHREVLRDAVDSGKLIIRSSSLVPISMATGDMLQDAVVLVSDLSQYTKQFGIEISTDTAATSKPLLHEAAPADLVNRAIASILAPGADACQLREALESEGCHFIVSANEPAILVDDRSGKSELHALKDLYSIACRIYDSSRNRKIGNLMRSSGASGSGARQSSVRTVMVQTAESPPENNGYHNLAETQTSQTDGKLSDRDNQKIPGHIPNTMMGKIAVTTAWTLEKTNSRRPTSQQVMLQLRQLAEDGKEYADTLRSAGTGKQGVKWVTGKGKEKPYEIEALEKTLSRWWGSLKSTAQ